MPLNQSRNVSTFTAVGVIWSGLLNYHTWCPKLLKLETVRKQRKRKKVALDFTVPNEMQTV